ncbi:PKD domain-containing protein [Chloroflexota bacterium]
MGDEQAEKVTQVLKSRKRGKIVTLVVASVAILSLMTAALYLFFQPKPDFQTSPNPVYLDKINSQVEVTFTNLSRNASFFEWHFGDDNTTSNEGSPRHLYTTPGNHMVTLKAGMGQRFKTITKTITVKLPETTPTESAQIGSTPTPTPSLSTTPIPIRTPAPVIPSPTPRRTTLQPSAPTVLPPPVVPTTPPPPPTPEPGSVAKRLLPFIVKVYGREKLFTTGIITLDKTSNRSFLLTDYNTIRGLEQVGLEKQYGAKSGGQSAGRDELINAAFLKMSSTPSDIPSIVGSSGSQPGEKAIVVGYSPGANPVFKVVTINDVSLDPVSKSNLIIFSPELPLDYLGAPLINFNGEIIGVVKGMALTPLGMPIMRNLNLALDPTTPADWMQRLQSGERILNPPSSLVFQPYVLEQTFTPFTFQYPSRWGIEPNLNQVKVVSDTSAIVDIQQITGKGINDLMSQYLQHWEKLFPVNERDMSIRLKDVSEQLEGPQVEFAGWRDKSGSYKKSVFFFEPMFRSVIMIQASTNFDDYQNSSGIFNRIIETFKLLPY